MNGVLIAISLVAVVVAANRTKDQAALPVLYALEDEIAAAERAGRESR